MNKKTDSKNQSYEEMFKRIGNMQKQRILLNILIAVVILIPFLLLAVDAYTAETEDLFLFLKRVFIAVVALIILVFLIGLVYKQKDKTDYYVSRKPNYDKAIFKDDQEPFNYDNNKQSSVNINPLYSLPGEVASPISVKRTLVRSSLPKTVSSTEKNYGNYNTGVTITTETAMYDVEEKFSDLPPLNAYPVKRFAAIGTDKITGKPKTLIVVGRDEASAEADAQRKGLINIDRVEPKYNPPSEAQKCFMKNLGMTVKPEYTKEDVHCILSRTHEREPAAEQWLIDFAIINNIPFSRYATNDNIIYNIRHTYLTGFAREVLFWVFCVNHFENKDDIFDNEKLGNIVANLCTNKDFVRLYKKAKSEKNINFLKPNKRIAAYKMTKAEIEK